MNSAIHLKKPAIRQSYLKPAFPPHSFADKLLNNKNMKTRKIIQILLLGLLVYPLYAQQTEIKVSGKVTDINNETLEGVTILLKSTIDSAYISGTITDTCGVFVLPKVKPDKYLLEFSMLGYKKQYLTIQTKESRPLPPVIMEEDAQLLSAVTITGMRKLMTMKPGTTTFDMDAMVLGSQGNVLDALRSLPGVMVNEDGSVILNGQTGIQVLVNGKSTYLSGDKLVNYLRSMPVSSIKNIDLITSPSAKYDAAGKTGLIDIRTQKVTVEGWTAQANTSYQQSADGKWNVGGRLTYQKNKLGLFLDYSHYQGKYKSTLDIFREYNLQNTASSPMMNINQNSRMKDRNQGDWARLGMNYDINDNFSFEVSTNGTLFNKRIPGSTDTYIQKSGSPVDSSLHTQSQTYTKQRAISGGLLLNYKNDKDQTADLSFDYLLHKHKQTLSMLNEMRNPEEQILNRDTLKGDMSSNIRMYSAQANWSMPLPAKFKFYSGLKFTWVDLDNSALYANLMTGQWLPDNSLSNMYKYNENINAAYIQINGQVGKFNLEAGLRLEQTRISGTQYSPDINLKDSSYTDNYIHLFPTLTIQYNIPETSNSISFLYNKRIIRPNYGDLSPFNYIWDDYTRSTGNPDLKAELTDNIEFAYIHKKLYRATLFFSYTNAPIMQNIEVSDDNVTIVYPENFKSNSRIGLRLDAGDLIQKRWWRISANATLFYSLYKWKESEKTIEKKLFTPSVSINNQFILPAGLNAEVSGFYNGRMALGQATVNPHWSVSMALQKKVWDDRLTLRLYANDVFQTNRQDLDLDLSGNIGKASTKQFNDYRCIGVSVSINLKQGKQSKKSNRDTSIDQSKRINL